MFVGVWVAVRVSEGVRVSDGVRVRDGVLVRDGVAVIVGERVAVGVFVGRGVTEGVLVDVTVAVDVGVRVTVGVRVQVGDRVAVGVVVMVRVRRGERACDGRGPGGCERLGCSRGTARGCGFRWGESRRRLSVMVGVALGNGVGVMVGVSDGIGVSLGVGVGSGGFMANSIAVMSATVTPPSAFASASAVGQAGAPNRSPMTASMSLASTCWVAIGIAAYGNRFRRHCRLTQCEHGYGGADPKPNSRPWHLTPQGRRFITPNRAMTPAH